MPMVSTLIIEIVIIEPTSEFFTSGFTWPLRGSKYQKKTLGRTIKIVPKMMENILKPLFLPGTNFYALLNPPDRNAGRIALSEHGPS